MSRRRSVQVERRTKKEPRLKPPQSCGTMRSIEDVLLSPVAEREIGSRKSDRGGCAMCKGL